MNGYPTCSMWIPVLYCKELRDSQRAAMSCWFNFCTKRLQNRLHQLICCSESRYFPS